MGFEIVLLMIMAGLFIGGGGIYACDPKGWNATGRRLSTMIRANLESGKKSKEVGAGITTKELLSDWDNQFQGKDMAVTTNQKPHEIVKTRVEKTSYMPWYYWWCRCGAKDKHVNEEAALRDFNNHLRHVKEEVARKKKAEEYKRKGLDREW